MQLSILLSILLIKVNSQDSSSSSVANYIDSNYQAFRASKFYTGIPKELQHKVTDDCFDLLRFGDNPVAPIESLEDTDEHYFPKVFVRSMMYNEFLFSMSFQPPVPLPDNRYFTLHGTGLDQSYASDWVEIQFSSTGDSCSNIAMYTENDQYILLLQHEEAITVTRGSISYSRHLIDETYDQGIGLLLYIPTGCQVQLTQAQRRISNPGVELLANMMAGGIAEISLITKHVSTH